MPTKKTNNYEGSGIYCFFPFDKLEEKNKGVFKIGNTTQTFQKRLQQYHTYFVNGVYVLFFISINAKNEREIPDFKHLLNVIEDYVMKLLKSKGGIIIVDKRRTWKQGQSEWVYSDIETIRKCFIETCKVFEKREPQLNFTFDGAHIEKTIKFIKSNFTKQNNRNKDSIHADYIFNVNEDDNFVEEKKKHSISIFDK